jgi:phage tail protein X
MAPRSGKPRQSAAKAANKTLAGIGDNSSAEEAEAREAIYRRRKKDIVDIMARREVAAAVVKAIQKELTATRNRFKAETLINLEQLDVILKKAAQTKGDLLKDAIDYDWMAEMEAIPRGGQLSLITAFAKTPTAHKDTLDWEGEGWRAYGRGDEPVAPAGCPSMHVPDFMKGWHGHEEKVAWSMEFTPPAQAVPDAYIDTGDEFEATPEELQGQITRQQVEGARASLDALGDDDDPDEENQDADELEDEPVA